MFNLNNLPNVEQMQDMSKDDLTKLFNLSVEYMTHIVNSYIRL